MFPTVAVVLMNAHIITMSPAQPTATSLALLDGRIAYVGDHLPLAKKAAGPEAEVIDLGGRTVIPGFNDAHVHFGLSITLGSERGLDLPDLKRREFVGAVTRAAKDHSVAPTAAQSEEWLFVKIPALPDGVERAADLDFVPRPLFVVTHRGGLMNHRALALARLSAAEAPHGFVRGRALPAAFDRVAKSLPAAFLEEKARQFLAVLAKEGITSAQLIDELPELFERLRLAGQLTARVRMIPLGYRFDTCLYASTWHGGAPEWLRVDGVKYFHDDWSHMPRFELEELLQASDADRRSVVVHVLSSRALESLLGALQSFDKQHPGAARRFRIDHADEVTADQAQRLARLGVTVCSNPSMIPEWRGESAFPLHSLLQAGVPLCIGTDFVGHHVPERPLRPLESLYLAATHAGFGHKERIEMAEALRAYTVGSAAAEGLSEEKGSLEPGKWADLVVLSGNPLEINPHEARALEVLATMVGGRFVYRNPTWVAEIERTRRRVPPPRIAPMPQSRPPTIGPADQSR
jgi:predicted amidohydrolase YtcJ